MKLEYLDDITDGGRYPDADPDKLIRLYDFDCTEVRQLQEAIRLQVISHNHPLMLSSLPFITAVNCQLTLILASTNEGISVASDNNDFKGLFTMASFEEMLAVMEPFTNESRNNYGYNWLYDPADRQIDLLLSPAGGW
ncbi:hypothetical protein HNQ91_005377 [Filimonas zeae]|uniref:Uncharacterized protein n=2 Tax=Filimonas zeae TaxID=1737353 RepID=A0A917MYU5_9BACT|nr:hypothetical protein [Filimonas zeae]MDR6342293.1 hypothetical protein [Filimonas zeae]GGH80752.1 hypothetical protein GCM10011379_52090 [Filimonas zeae]